MNKGPPFSPLAEANAATGAVARSAIPLVVDLDGTLIRSDLLLETFFEILGRSPYTAIKSLSRLFRGKAVFKQHVAQEVEFNPERLPYNEVILTQIAEARSQGRKVYLASASDEHLVRKVSDYLGLFDGWMASDGSTNLKGDRKAKRLVEEFGEMGFDYIGNEFSDIPVWKCAATAIIVDMPPETIRHLRPNQPAQLVAAKQPSLRTWLKLLRPHQWVKNVLLFIPILTSHFVTASSVFHGLTAFVAFSLCASGVYVMNDIVDVNADRQHPTKSKRPFASGDIAILPGAGLGILLILSAFIVASTCALAFIGALALYFATNIAYSFYLKRKMLVDVVTLAGLYTLRVIAGAAAIGVAMSEWLLAFSMFTFLFLALIKRHSEMIMRSNAGLSDPSNRNYKAEDIPVLSALAAAAGYSSVIVFSLYIASDAARSLYTRGQFLWLICPVLIYWISRVLMLSQREHIHDDPLLFAIKDRVTWMVAVTVLVLGVLAI